MFFQNKECYQIFAAVATYSAEAYQWPQLRANSYDMEFGIIYRRTANDRCSVCIADKDCFVFDSVRCDYYLETSKILSGDEKLENLDSDLNPQLKAEADSMMYSVIEKARTDSTFKDCIPYVSKYTDCTKDTICTGCKACDCDGSGRWNCTIKQVCRPELIKPAPNHRTLFMVLKSLKQASQNIEVRRKRSIEEREYKDDSVSHSKLTEWIYGEPTLNVDSIESNMYEQQYKNIEPSKTIQRNKNDNRLLKIIVNTLIHDTLPGIFKDTNLDFENNRVKRKTSNEPKKVVNNKTKITFDLSDWLNNVHPYVYTEINNESNNSYIRQKTSVEVNQFGKNFEVEKVSTTAVSRDDPALSHSNTDYLAFEEVYNNIALDNKNYSRRKPLLDMEHKENIDTDFHMYDDKYYYDEVATPSTNRSVDPNIKNLLDELGVTLPPELNAVTKDITNYYLETVTEVVVDLLETANNDKFNTVNYKDLNNKIDNPNLAINDLNVINIMKRDVSHLHESNLNLTNVTKPVISSAIIELKDGVLFPIDQHLKNKQKEIEQLVKIRDNLIKFLNTHTDSNTTKSRRNYLSIYKLEYLPHHHQELYRLRTSNVSLLNKYEEKLKHDVYEVIRDIIAIKRLYNDSSKMSDNLSFLIKSMKHYIHKQGFHYRKKPNLRRSYNNYDSVKAAIINVIQLLDKNKPKANALAPLSPYTRRIVKRIIRRNYVDELSRTGLRVYDPHYNLTDDLSHIGTKWMFMFSKVETSSVFDRFYNIKNLHLILSVDVAKINDALALVYFAKSRRMIPIDEVLAYDIITNVNRGIMWMKSRFDKVLTAHTKRSNPSEINPYISPEVPQLTHNTKNYKKKESFLMQIETLLQNSKRDIMKLIHRNVPKTDIVKEIARKTIEEINNKKLKDTMQKWQTNLNILRKRRSANAFDSLTRRMTNIIPKYLRGKVSRKAIKMGKAKKKHQ